MFLNFADFFLLDNLFKMWYKQGCGAGFRNRSLSNFGWLEPGIWVPFPQTYFVGQASCTNNAMVFNFQWRGISKPNSPRAKTKRAPFLIIYILEIGTININQE